MKVFFKVTHLEEILGYRDDFPGVECEEVPLEAALDRILGEEIHSIVNLPDFMRSTMDGYAVAAASTFGASEGSPAYLTVKGSVVMGASPDFTVAPGEAAKISTGGMLPPGTDGVVMIEHTARLDDTIIEVYKSVGPGGHVVQIGEDVAKGETLLSRGTLLRPQEVGLLAAFGIPRVKVYKRPVIGIISTGDEVVPLEETPGPGKIRDINSYTLAGLVQRAGGVPKVYGIVRDQYDDLLKKCALALKETDMILISGGSSMGARDFTIDVINALPEAKILAHGISISPGKPTILARVGDKAFWGLPGHVVSAMVVFKTVVAPFIERISGVSRERPDLKIKALLNRNVSSAQGRIDYVRVRLKEKDSVLWAEPVMGKSALINTMVKADGLIEIGINTEGLDKGAEVTVIPL